MRSLRSVFRFVLISFGSGDKIQEACPSWTYKRFGVAGTDEVNSYYAFPGTCYSFMLERTKLLSDSLEDGFAPK